METAGADEMPDEVERKGLGTPATRAGIIEKLVRIGFLERKGDKKTKHLIPTHKGTALVTVMPEQIQSPSMTADWEEKLLLIEKGEYASENFMDEIKDVIAGLIQNYEVCLLYTSPGGEYTDYDIPGEALTDTRFANMIREAEKYLGYPYVWGHVARRWKQPPATRMPNLRR